MSAENAPSVILRHTSFSYQQWGAATSALQDINLCLPSTGFVLVRGHNASGKSTLLKLIGGLLRPGAGSVEVFGRDPSRAPPTWRARHIGYVDQHPDADLVAGLTIDEHLRLLGQEWTAFASELRRLDPSGHFSFLSDCRRQTVDRLSGGQRQSFGLALQLVRPVPLLLLDEPFAALDLERTAAFTETLRRIAKDRCVVHVTHAAAPANAAEITLRLTGGRLVKEERIDK